MPFGPLQKLAFAFCLLTSAHALAVVISSGDGTGNTTAPPDDPGFANVGVSSNGLTGVYLGNRWVLTAAHVGERDFNFGGVWYGAVPGSRRQIKKSGVKADLAMIKLAYPPPPLPDVTLATAPIAVDDVVTMIGNGWTRAANLTCWNGAFGEVSCPGGVFEGYKKAAGRVLRWGLNKVTAIDQDHISGSVVTRSFVSDFDEAGEADEAQVVPGDSGGATFFKRGGDWELVGIHFVMGVFMSQPDDTAIFGNMSYDVDLEHYGPEIQAIYQIPPNVPAMPWPLLVLGAGALLGVARRSLPGAGPGRHRRQPC